MDRIMAPKDACALIPGPCEYPTDGMKAAHQLALRRGDYPGGAAGPRGAQVLKHGRRKQGGQSGDDWGVHSWL